jgi:hypothetical protein
MTVGDYSVTSSEIENFIKVQGSLVGELFGPLNVAEKADVVKPSASLALNIVDGVSKISAASKSDGSKDLPAALPAELAQVRTHAFIYDVLQLQTEQLLVTKSRQYINDIKTEHREILRTVTVSSEKPLQKVLENQPKSTGFSEAWAVFQGRFELCPSIRCYQIESLHLMDDEGIDPPTSPMLREHATICANHPSTAHVQRM